MRTEGNISSSWSLRLLHWYCPPALLEEIEGDLVQKFENDQKKLGVQRAKNRLLWNTLRFFRPEILLRNHLSLNLNAINMLHAYFKFAFRNIRNHRVFSFVNISGLAVGIALSLMILQYVLHEKSFDQFHKNKDEIVRATYSRFIDGEFQFSKAQVFPAVAQAMAESLPDIQSYVRMFPVTSYVEAVLTTERNGKTESYVEGSIFAVDSTFLSVFTLPLVHGNPAEALNGDHHMILSAYTANKFFGNEDPINKIVNWNGEAWTITGVFHDLPENSHLKFNILTSWMNVYGDRALWNWDGFFTYFLLKPGTDLSELESAVQKIADKKMESTSSKRVTAQFHLQRLEDIHLQSHLTGEMRANGNASVVSAMIIVACLVLGLALINYQNLSLARAIRRTREVGLRKIIGSSRMQIKGLFFTEAIVINIIAFLLAVGMCVLLRGPFQNIVGGNRAPLWETDFWLKSSLAVTFIAIAAALSSMYPSQLLARSNPASTVKGMNLATVRGSWFRKGLVSFQFAVTILLLIGTVVIYRQTNYMKNRDLGFSLNQNLVIKTLAGPGAEMNPTFQTSLKTFKTKAKDHSAVHHATITSTVPGQENTWVGRLQVQNDAEQMITTTRTRVDEDYLDTYQLHLLEGINFTQDQEKAMLLNEAAVKALGYASNAASIGATVMGDFKVIGIVNDFHDQSLHRAIMPSFYTMGQGYMKYLTINIDTEKAYDVLSYLQKEWKIIFPDTPFEYFFLNDYFNQQYQQDQQLGEAFGVFAGLGVFVACLGLLGFTYFILHQRTKEISIRKILGATGGQLLQLLTSDLAFMLLIAALVATPLSYYFAKQWLTTYAYQMELSPLYFIGPLVVIAALSSFSILLLIARAIATNPAENLKHE